MPLLAHRRNIGQAIVLSALLLVGAGCTGASGTVAALSSQEGRCLSQGEKTDQENRAAEPGMLPLHFETHYSAKLGACLFYDEYRGKSKEYPDASWVVNTRIINTDTGAVIAEYLAVDAAMMSKTDFHAVEDEKNMLFRQ